MRIVILDGHAMNPGDLSWDSLRELGDLTVYERTPEDEIVSRAADAEILLTNKAPLTRERLQALPKLKYIGVQATGYNVVDTVAAKAQGIVVTNVPGYSTMAVAQMTFALILELSLHVGAHAAACRDGRWAASPDFCFWDTPLSELTGKTLGIVGMGAIGTRVAAIAESFGMHVLGYSPSRWPAEALEQLWTASDIVTLHCPLTATNRGMVNEATIARMKRGAWLINTARGGLIQEEAVCAALKSGQLGAYAADVLNQEPPSAENPLLRAPNTIFTPHIAWAPYEARKRLYRVVVDNVRAFLEGRPINVVN